MIQTKKDSGVKFKAIGLAILAALLYGVSSPVAKLLLRELPPVLMAALLYLGAGFGMAGVNAYIELRKKERFEAQITKNETKYILWMIVLDIAAPILLMFGLSKTTAANASLLNNFEIVATSLIALFIFKETVGRRMWFAITLITISSIILSVSDFSSLSFSLGSIFVLLACIFWGLENNCTRMLSLKDPLQIVVIKGLGSGTGSALICFYLKAYSNNWLYIAIALLLGFVTYGLGIFLYIRAQRDLGAARTSAYYATAPFIGVLISFLVLHEPITKSFLIALAIMLLGTYFAVSEDHKHKHAHNYERHEHKHRHDDGHHMHMHDEDITFEHSHEHTHDLMEHKHAHTPDLHHRHMH
ncbi:DMT family transporter [Fusibacter sp. A1]|nr:MULTISPECIES: DMT family transporter [unclassified Fusibacter]MCK8059013.1 DMT family transporter [Fusibacter sp. A2]NPE22424.1 DMT family transporter [Fusibacter sp. A1]RXV60711.1 DMT family transporter [Fusibacter sp. A1]